MSPKETPRFKKPGIRDPRLVIGIFIVLLSVLGVIGIVRVTNQTESFYSVTGDIGIGETVSKEDLTVINVRLAGSSGVYVSAEHDIAPGTVAKRPLVAGELLSTSAITTDLQEGRRLVTLLKDDYAVADFKAGDRVDIWVSSKGENGSTFGEPTVIAEDAEIHSVTAQESVIGGTGKSAVEVWVNADLLASVLAATNDGSVINLVPSDYTGGE